MVCVPLLNYAVGTAGEGRQRAVVGVAEKACSIIGLGADRVHV